MRLSRAIILDLGGDMKKIYILMLVLAGLTIFNAALFAYDVLARGGFGVTAELAVPLVVGLAAAAFGIRIYRKITMLSVGESRARQARSLSVDLPWAPFVVVFAVLGLVVLFLSLLDASEASKSPLVVVYIFYASMLIYGFFRYRLIRIRYKADDKTSTGADRIISDLFGGAIGWFWFAATLAVTITVVLTMNF